MEQHLPQNVLAIAFISAMERHIPRGNTHHETSNISEMEVVITIHLTGDLGFTKVRFYLTSQS